MHGVQRGAHGQQCGRARGPGGVGFGAGGAVGRGRLLIGNKPFNSIISPEGAFLGYVGAQSFGYDQD
eukprot:3544182-Rhodomonas_salina.1